MRPAVLSMAEENRTRFSSGVLPKLGKTVFSLPKCSSGPVHTFTQAERDVAKGEKMRYTFEQGEPPSQDRIGRWS